MFFVVFVLLGVSIGVVVFLLVTRKKDKFHEITRFNFSSVLVKFRSMEVWKRHCKRLLSKPPARIEEDKLATTSTLFEKLKYKGITY